MWLCKCANVSRLCQFIPRALEHPVVHAFDCECSLRQRALSQNECLLEIKPSLFILVIPAGGRKAERDPGLYIFFKKIKGKKKESDFFSFPLQSSQEPPASVLSESPILNELFNWLKKRAIFYNFPVTL